jgi:hypothetical protein
MANYSVKKGQQEEYNLFVDETQSICPFVQPIPMQGNMGQVQLHRLPCTSVCPLAEFNGIDLWTLHCGGEKRSISVKKELSSSILEIVK